MTGRLATMVPVWISSASRLTVSRLSVKKTRSRLREGEQPLPQARPPPVVASPSWLSLAPTLL